MKLKRAIGNVAAVIGLGWLLLEAFLRLHIAPWATIGLVHFAAWFGIEAPDQIEAFGGLLMLIVAALIALGVVWGINRLVGKKARPLT
ncbi:UNVERIFIED_ORG: ACR3 family arsenite efflux pump ArsB [Burkholderia sp. 1595]|uniref:ACR3 family arsenite efflux pump ArsB n=1 Tax=Paraburkholderia terricola TaxID=169427 RepID=A0ABU1LZV4_9BURK|nr:hypothetical protein [Paraburkholderia terricola]MDR6412217.1 ACR3 family arsenite efflux pump ArsB [Paraburkholderia terricola]